MRTQYNRRTAMKVNGGKVQRKNRHIPTTHQGYVIDREQPGRGYRHVVTKQQLMQFLGLIPDWEQLSHRLERIVLSAGEAGLDGFHQFYRREGTCKIALCAWQRDLWVRVPHPYFKGHRPHLEELGVSVESHRSGVLCTFSEKQARAFSLMHVFMHELGHHLDWLENGGDGSTSGEIYAETFANQRFHEILPAYVATFGDPAVGEAG